MGKKTSSLSQTGFEKSFQQVGLAWPFLLVFSEAECNIKATTRRENPTNETSCTCYQENQSLGFVAENKKRKQIKTNPPAPKIKENRA